MSYDPTVGRWMEQDPAGYIDGPNMYQFVEGNPIDLVDPSGLQAAGAAAPAAPAAQALPISGDTAINGNGYSLDVHWDLKKLDPAVWPKNPKQVLFVAKVKYHPGSKKCPHLLFIGYGTGGGDAVQQFSGGDRYNQAGRDKGKSDDQKQVDPYVFTPGEQDNVNKGDAYGGRLNGKYDNKFPDGSDADAVFVDTPGEPANGKYHHSVVLKIICSCRADYNKTDTNTPEDHVVGAITYSWDVDAAGKITGSVAQSTQKEIDDAKQGLFPPYSTKFIDY